MVFRGCLEGSVLDLFSDWNLLSEAEILRWITKLQVWDVLFLGAVGIEN